MYLYVNVDSRCASNCTYAGLIGQYAASSLIHLTEYAFYNTSICKCSSLNCKQNLTLLTVTCCIRTSELHKPVLPKRKLNYIFIFK